MMEHRRLGRTEHRSTVAVFGAACVARATQDEADAAFADALARGINHVDVAPRYGDAEVLLGPLVEPVRDSLFLGCKTTRRDPDGVRAQLEESLTRLRTDHFDLYQMHGVTSVDVLDERRHAAEVVLHAREEGMTRFAGITGHDHQAPRAFLEALRRYDLDTVMFPVNARMWADPLYRTDAEALLELCAERDLGVMAIKAVARRPWDAGDRFATTWYEPLTDADAIARAVSFTLSTLGVHALCTPGDMRLARKAMDAAVGAGPMGAGERDAMIAAAADVPSIFPIPA